MIATHDSGNLSIARRIYRKLKRIIRPPLHCAQAKMAFTVLGSDYGGWPVLDGSLTEESIVYSFGVGHDISFDLAAIERFGCTVVAFDPTPRSIAWLEAQELPTQFGFHAFGISDKNEILEFAAPAKQSHVSYTVGQSAHSEGSVALPVKPLDEIMQDLGHTSVDLLKMDVEGSEYVVISHFLATGIRPRQLCVEFHHGMFGYENAHTNTAVQLLKDAGYVLFYVSEGGREYGFALEGG